MKPTKHFMERIATAERVAQERATFNLANLSCKQLEIVEAFCIDVEGQNDEIRGTRWAEVLREFPDIAIALEVGQSVAT
jgi:hypothetical protein